jgi:hypothetical protein
MRDAQGSQATVRAYENEAWRPSLRDGLHPKWVSAYHALLSNKFSHRLGGGQTYRYYTRGWRVSGSQYVEESDEETTKMR